MRVLQNNNKGFNDSRLTTRYGTAGACVNPTSLQRVSCALIPAHCDDSAEFRSPRWIFSQPVDHSTRVCTTQESLKAITIGRCASPFDKGICTSSAVQCKLHSRFEPRSLLCNVASSNHPDSTHPESRYGRCATYHFVEDKPTFCAWDDGDCFNAADTPTNAQYYWWSPLNSNHLHGDGCTCDQVQMGACVTNKNGLTDLYCAVGPKACEEDMTYIPILELRNGYLIQCFLCRELTLVTVPQTAAPTTISHADIVNRNAPPTQAPVSITDPSKESSTSSSLSSEAIAGIIGAIVGALLVIAFLYGLVQLYKRRARAKAHQQLDTTAQHKSSPTDNSAAPSSECTDSIS